MSKTKTKDRLAPRAVLATKGGPPAGGNQQKGMLSQVGWFGSN
jgi:hypothetical protein